MAIRDIFKVSRKTFINPSAWLDYSSLKQANFFLFQSLKGIFTVPKPGKPETFEEAVRRTRMTETDIQQNIVLYQRYALFFVFCGLIVFFFSFFLLFRYSAFLDWILGLSVTVLFLAQAFRYDFWAYSMKQRRLGLTFQDWKRHIIGEKDHSND